MFDNFHSLGKESDRLPSNIKEEISVNALRDGIASLNYRISEIESIIIKKMDRSECLSIFQKKVSFSHLKRYMDEVQAKLTEEQRQEEERNIKMQEIAIDKINQLGKRFKSINVPKAQKVEGKSVSKQKQRRLQPQQLFLQSSETMFSLLIEEITKLQEKQCDFDRQLQSRNKKTINLNNEVCRKIDRLQAYIQERCKPSNEGSETKLLNNSWSRIERNNKGTVHKGFSEISNFQSMKLDLVYKNLEALQKEVVLKMNIRDVLPIVRQDTQPIGQALQGLRTYVEESMDSTRKILASQTEINREMSLGSRVGWWLSYEQQNEIAIINKELMNLLPQVFEVANARLGFNNYITVLHQGVYILRLLTLYNPHVGRVISENSSVSEVDGEQFEVMIGTEVRILGRESALRLDKNTEIRVIMRCAAEILVGLQKL